MKYSLLISMESRLKELSGQVEMTLLKEGWTLSRTTIRSKSDSQMFPSGELLSLIKSKLSPVMEGPLKERNTFFIKCCAEIPVVLRVLA